MQFKKPHAFLCMSDAFGGTFYFISNLIVSHATRTRIESPLQLICKALINGTPTVTETSIPSPSRLTQTRSFIGPARTVIPIRRHQKN